MYSRGVLRVFNYALIIEKFELIGDYLKSPNGAVLTDYRIQLNDIKYENGGPI